MPAGYRRKQKNGRFLPRETMGSGFPEEHGRFSRGCQPDAETCLAIKNGAKKIPALFFRDAGKWFQSKRESIAAAAASSGEMYPSRAMSMSTMAVRCFASSGWSMGSYADGA